MNAEKSSTKECKIRRVQLKKKSSVSTTTVETREGITYESGVLSQTANIPVHQLETIPPPPPPQHIQVPLPPDDYNREYFDLETTGLGLSCEIIQLAAACGNECFSCYVMPKSPVQEQATRVTGMTFDGTTLYKRGLPHEAVSLDEYGKYKIKFRLLDAFD
ncbi:uncharacterized protein LOC133180315 [Saccostrea echinata]|uniref:uncharacterized protein LOC133180315 n=1 Tax=Saccostrea echinata TaxID=191078 RepID=UPI002A7FBB79|nr:uncharacterized protein LOC133180315 [Saccostrea echinata]